jgi:hypothetical protein
MGVAAGSLASVGSRHRLGSNVHLAVLSLAFLLIAARGARERAV